MSLPEGNFADEIRALIASDRATPPPTAPVLFYGSSSIRLWSTLAADFPGWPVLNRGFGGSTLQECITYFDWLVKPYNPSRIIFYAGDNDLDQGVSSERIAVLFAVLMHKIRTVFPEVPVTFIAIKACPARWWNRKKIVKANSLVEQMAASLPNVSFLNVFPAMLGPEGHPNPALVEEDGLHLNAEGYRLWARMLREHLEQPKLAILQSAEAAVGSVPGSSGIAGNTGSGTAGVSEAGAIHREYHKWFSHRMNRDMELLIFGHAGPRMLAFPTRRGRFYEYEDHGIIDAFRPFLEEGKLQVFCVDGVDEESFYCDWKAPRDRMERHLQYESYVREEVIPLTQKVNPHPDLVAFGCSLGGYHAVNIAFRHPQLFRRVLAFSGRYDLTIPFEDGFADLLSGYYDEQVYLNMPPHFIPNLQDETLLEQIRKLDLVLVVGEEDPFCQHTRDFSRLLWDKGIWHALHLWTGRAHRFRYWRQMARIYYHP